MDRTLIPVNLKYWQAFCASVQEVNSYAKPGVLRSYQAELLNSGRFVVVSPTSGLQVFACSSIPIAHRIGYLFGGREPFWLITDKFQHGHPISEFATEDRAQSRLLFQTEKVDPADGLSDVEFERLRARSTAPDSALRSQATLLIGHANFAHHLWNELTGLEEWLNAVSDDVVSGLSVLATAEPLGDLQDIFPRLSLASFCRRETQVLRVERLRAPLLVRIGSRLVSKRVRRLLCEYSKVRADSAAVRRIREILAKGWPRLWISVRHGSRTPDNQAEFLLSVVRAVFSSYPDATIAFDGFSFPAGFFEDPRTLKFREAFAARAADADNFIASLRDQVVRELGTRVGSRVCSISGLSLLEAINIGDECNYYVCHAGTLQHKIGWLHDIPGFVHSDDLRPSRATWYAAQVEDGIAPDLLPSHLSVPTSAPAGNKAAVSRNFNYRITDTAKAAEAVLASMETRLNKLKR